MTPAKMFRGVVETVRAAWQDAVDRWGAMPRTPRVTSVLLAFMIVGGVILRIQGIGFPPRNTFDEQFYGPTAHHFLLGVPDHARLPSPAGQALGSHRASSCSATTRWDGGSCICVLACRPSSSPSGWHARSLRAGGQVWLAAAFVAADGFFIVYSRTAFIDGMLICCILWSVLAVVTARTWRGMAVAAVFDWGSPPPSSGVRRKLWCPPSWPCYCSVVCPGRPSSGSGCRPSYTF